MIVTTEEWVSGYLKRLVFFAENEAEQSGFDKELGGKLVSFCLYSAMFDIPDIAFEKQLITFSKLCSKSVEDCKNFFELYEMISRNCLQFSHYVKNTQAFDYIKTHNFLKSWRQGNGGHFVAVWRHPLHFLPHAHAWLFWCRWQVYQVSKDHPSWPRRQRWRWMVA